MMGAVMFAFFYWIAPWLILYQWESNPIRSPHGMLIQQAFERRLYWFEYIGVALGLVGAFFAIKNYVRAKQLTRSGERYVGLFARLLSRIID